ncbi:MAG: Adenylate cyclase 1 [Candidatus Omnitrophica bacterium ADurb.Bin292]|nr:MAG: Adenylate cyclase 1 [Candidatus Omnitrophica bacterium ADurb.Bin292]
MDEKRYNPFMRKILPYLVPALVLAGILFLLCHFSAPIEDFRIMVFDNYQRIHPRVYKDTPVRIIDIDDKSLERFGQWPWPRTVLARLVDRLHKAGVQTLAFDVVFAEPDRTSPQSVISSWPDVPALRELRAQLSALPDHDALFAEVSSEARVVFAFGLINETTKNFPTIKFGGFLEHGTLGDQAIDYIRPAYRGAVTNLPALESAAKGLGGFNVSSDEKDMVRRASALFRLRETIYPSLALEAMRVFQEASAYKISLAGTARHRSFGEKTGIVSIKTGFLDIPTDKHGRIWLFDTGHKPERFIPAWKIFSADFDLSSLDGKLVFVGTSATGLKDLRPTPLNAFAPGVEVHAQIAEQMFTGDYLHRPDWTEGAEFLYILVLGLLLVLLLPSVGAIWCALLGASAIGFAIWFSWNQYVEKQLLIDPLVPSLSILLIYLVSSFIRFVKTETERGQIRSAFSRYLSPALVGQLAKNPKQLKLGGETREMSFLFMDIRGFTTLAEGMSAEELTNFMNSFMTPMTEIILKHNGTIDKYIGDCIMAFWNAPLDDVDHAKHACQAALEMRDFIQTFNAARKEKTESRGKPFKEVKIGIGINTGLAAVGNMGSEYRFDYTVMGDEVNLASRLEALTKEYEITIIIGPNTAKRVPELNPEELGTISIRGKTILKQIFSLP